MAGPRAIETVYRGNRYRSRLEARWAVTLDALKIEYVYESEGFELGEAGRYLPDFWLPRQRTYLEIKPEDGPTEEADAKAMALAKASECPVFILRGVPGADVELRAALPDHRYIQEYGRVSLCIGCGSLTGSFNGHPILGICICLETAPHTAYDPRLLHRLDSALLVGKQARFEHGESGMQAIAGRVVPPGQIYFAGKINGCADWRSEIYGDGIDNLRAGSMLRHGKLAYGGPELILQHGEYLHRGGVVSRCLFLINHADAVFCWIDREDVHGTLVELGYAAAFGKPTFIAFGSSGFPIEGESLGSRLWFAQELATAAVSVPGVAQAWDLFLTWWTQRSNS